MLSHLFIQGMLLGFSIAAPVGPIGILCIDRTLRSGQWIGLITGLGAATADAIYGGIAGLGLTGLAGILMSYRYWIQSLGSLCLWGLGWHILGKRRDGTNALLDTQPDLASPSEPIWARGLKAYSSGLGLTLTNPMTILSLTAIFAGLGVGTATSEFQDAVLLVMGVFLGSALWWGILSSGIHRLRPWLPPQALRWTHVLSGLLILALATLTLITLLIEILTTTAG